jgi:hypothetical protein
MATFEKLQKQEKWHVCSMWNTFVTVVFHSQVHRRADPLPEMWPAKTQLLGAIRLREARRHRLHLYDQITAESCKRGSLSVWQGFCL